MMAGPDFRNITLLEYISANLVFPLRVLRHLAGLAIRPPPAGVAVAEDSIGFDYKSRRVVLHFSDADTKKTALLNFEQNFKGGWAEGIDVGGRRVIDIGSGIGDTAIKFAIDGAAKVLCFDPDMKRNVLAWRNAEANGFAGKILVLGKQVDSIAELRRYRADIIKCDIDGGEYPLFLEAEDRQLSRYSQIMLEYHFGYKNLAGKLEGAGFRVTKTSPVKTYAGGRMYYEGVIIAKRKRGRRRKGK